MSKLDEVGPGGATLSFRVNEEFEDMKGKRNRFIDRRGESMANVAAVSLEFKLVNELPDLFLIK